MQKAMVFRSVISHTALNSQLLEPFLQITA